MSLKTRVMLNTFTASLASTMLQRGAYFFTHDIRGFSQAQNLWLALFVGITYIGGAYNSHRVTVRFGERRTLVCILGALAVLHVLLAFSSSSAFLVGTLAVVACLQGAMWPIFESYISAGETPADLGRLLSRYNISWALSTAPALFLAGLLITSGFPWLLFVVAAVLFALVLLSCLAFPQAPPHFDEEHPARPPSALLERYRGLLVAARFAMLGSYMMMYVLAPLMPEIMRNVGFGTAAAARAAGVLDIARLASFLGLFVYAGWHGRKTPIFFAILALPIGFGSALFGASAFSVLSGEVLFGAAAGFLYTAALYYAQLVENASVDAGGAHEALIGVGYALGPSAGLVGTALAGGAGPGSAAYVRGMSIATLPLIIACSLFALWPLVRPQRTPI
ncbi:MAG: MFS transporter [Myxococcales bacterium]